MVTTEVGEAIEEKEKVCASVSGLNGS